MASYEFHERLYKKFRNFFDEAEQERRWNPLRDVPWNEVNPDVPEELALCAETFLGVESFLPDYIKGGIEVVRASSVAQRWFTANWGYEELKHSMALTEYLIRSGKRTEEQMHDFQAQLMEQEWERPFPTARQMTIYGMFQEQATFVIYVRHEKLALSYDDRALATCYRLNARDECAHARFYEYVVAAYLDEDRDGTVADLAHVARHFRMPGINVVPDYARRIEVMRGEGKMDRDVFLKKVYFPILRRLKVTRQEMTAAARQQRQEAAAAGAPSV